MVTWKDRQFYINDEPIEIHAGSIHYFRSMPDKWYDLLLKLKNCGLNTVETYCAWNLHEPYQGEYDFTGRLDIERFIQIATELGLYVIVRPGPFICAEWEFGGLPGWLLADERMRFRTDEGEYLDYVRTYFRHLMPHIIPYLETNGGNVILIAAENEYGSFGNSTQYMNKCVDMLIDCGVDVPIFTSDGHMQMFLDGGHADGCLCALDFGYTDGVLNSEHTDALWKRQPDAPAFHVEFWIGMFSHWGRPAQIYKTEYVAEELQKHLEQNMSFSFYMFHGGTNFGFTNGANMFLEHPEQKRRYTYLPDVTSYDYDALLTEWGEITPKYKAVQKIMSQHLGVELPTPEPVPLMSLGDIKLTEKAGLFENLTQIGNHYTSSYLHNMEYYGQNYGYILYRTKVCPTERIHMLAIDGVADRALVYFNGIYRGIIHRNDEKDYLEVDGWMDEGGTLDILVENQGRVNFGHEMDKGDRKGILKHVIMYQKFGPSHILCNWDVYTLPMEQLERLEYKTDKEVVENRPIFYRGTFKAEEKKDCFIHPDNFTKGFIVVNGFNLGRYWEIGPQRSLYLPGAILKDENEIIVFDEKPSSNPVISIKDYHILDSMKTDEGPETIM
ncbi:MAG: beta-galactosidase [Tyzzerella sp.]|nr:beta-galactosidase [Tyzzerella sp.]